MISTKNVHVSIFELATASPESHIIQLYSQLCPFIMCNWIFFDTFDFYELSFAANQIYFLRKTWSLFWRIIIQNLFWIYNNICHLLAAVDVIWSLYQSIPRPIILKTRWSFNLSIRNFLLVNATTEENSGIGLVNWDCLETVSVILILNFLKFAQYYFTINL